MADICEAEIPREQLGIRGATQQSEATSVERTKLVRLRWAPAGSSSTPEATPSDFVEQLVAVTTSYRYLLMPEGFSIGKHLYSTTLLPGEEQELEVFQSQKTETELKSSSSVETEFLQEYEQVVQEETQKTEESNFAISGGLDAGVNLGIVSVGAEVDASHSTKEIDFHKQASSDTHKTSDRTTRKNDMSMGTKTEVVTTTRSTRRIRNPNLCQSVTWNFFQLQRRLRVKLVLQSITFDIFSKGSVPNLIDDPALPLPFKSRQATLRDFRIARPTRDAVLSKAQADSLFDTSPLSFGGGPFQAVPRISPAVINAAEERVGAGLQFAVRKLTLDELVKKAEKLGVFVSPFLTGGFAGSASLETARDNFREAVQTKIIDALSTAAQGATPPFIAREEVVEIATNSAHAEPVTSQCLGCDTHTALEQQLEREKLALERDKLRKEVLAAASVAGTVKGLGGPASGVVVQLTDRGVTPFVVVGQTVTDDNGSFTFGIAGMFPTAGRALRLAVVPPLPERADGASPDKVDFTFDGRQVEVHFFLS